MSLTAHFWACHRGVTGLSQGYHPFFLLDAKCPENNIWHVTHMSMKCHQSVTKLHQVPPNGNSTSWWFKFCKNVQKGYFLWHFGNKSLTHVWHVQSYFLEVLHPVEKNSDIFVTALWHPCDMLESDLSQTCHKNWFLSNWSTITRKHLWTCHTYVTETSRKCHKNHPG